MTQKINNIKKQIFLITIKTLSLSKNWHMVEFSNRALDVPLCNIVDTSAEVSILCYTKIIQISYLL